jgi:hypothetical protein
LKLEDTTEPPYRIIQSCNGEVRRIVEVDSIGRVIFEYKNEEELAFFKTNEPQIFIDAYEFDNEGNTARRFSFSSNAVQIIYYYNYDNKKSSKTTFIRTYSKGDDVINESNAFSDLSQMQSFNDLKPLKKNLNLIAKPQIRLYLELLRQDSKPIKVYENSNIFEDSIMTNLEYNSEGKEVLVTMQGVNSKEMKRKISIQYPSDSCEIREITNFRLGQKFSVYQTAKKDNTFNNTITEYSEINGKLYIGHKTYDDYDRLTSITSYETLYEGKLIIPIIMNLNKTAEMAYFYNEQGLLEKEIMNNYKTGITESRIYTYQIMTQ